MGLPEFMQLIKRLEVALEQNGWKGRYTKPSITAVGSRLLICTYQLHPLNLREREWALSAGVYVHDWKQLMLSMGIDDGHCVLEMPRQVYPFHYQLDDIDAVFNAAFSAHDHDDSDITQRAEEEETIISQEAVDMFVESIVKNASGTRPSYYNCDSKNQNNNNIEALMKELCFKIQHSSAWSSSSSS